MIDDTIEDAATPWSSLDGIASVRVLPIGRPIDADMAIPGSKSLSNRALILAAMAEGTTELSGLLRSDDTYWCIDALRRLGAAIEVDGMTATIRGIGRRRPHSGVLHIGSSGTLGRFLPTYLAAGAAGEWRVNASQQMMRRPIGTLFQGILDGGGDFEFLGKEGCYPVIMRGDSFRGGKLTMAGNVSSQFISGILMGAVHSRDGLDLTVEGGIVQGDYVRITIDAMRHFGATVAFDDGLEHFTVAPGTYHAQDMAVEADASTATYFAGLAAVTGGRIKLTNLTPATRQPDYGFLETLERLGCAVTRGASGTTIVGARQLRGGFTIDMKPNSDATLALAALAPFADGPITITGVEHIRHHESDRIDAICRSLEKLGVPVEEHRDGLTVTPAIPGFAMLDTYEDHRVAMSLAMLGAAGNGVELRDPTCVSKTCPDFFELIGDLGVESVLTPVG